MTTTIKITELTDIGANLAGTTLVPVVNMAGTPTTERANVNNIANYVLNKATGANLGPVANVKITGGTTGQVLTTNGSNVLSWTTVSSGNGTPGGSNTQIQFNDADTFGGNSGFTFNKTTGIFTSPFLAGNGNGLSNIQGANINGAVSLATFATTANSVAGANVSGAVSYATTANSVAGANVSGAVSFAGTANSVAVGNVSGLGNIATVNLTGSSSNVLYGNGVFAAASGGATDELVNGDNSFVLDSDGNVVFHGLASGDGVDRGLVWDYGANANGINSQVRQDHQGITVRAYTTNSGNYSAPVNIVTNQDANIKTWTFDGDGNLTLASNLIIPGDIFSLSNGIAFTSSLTSIDTANSIVIITVADNVFTDPYSGPVTISGVNAPSQVNGNWYYQALDGNQFQLYTNSSLSTPVDGSAWPGYPGGDGTAVGTVVYTDFTIQGGNVSVSSNDETWTFDSNGVLNTPNNSSSFVSGRIQTANGYPTLLGYGSGGHGGPELDYCDSDDPANVFENPNVYRNVLYINDNGLYVGMNENGNTSIANGANNSWLFAPNGSTRFPTKTVDLHNGGNQQAETLQFGNGSVQAVITGPTPAPDTNAQRLIIQGQRGNGTYSEGGDVYLWAGDAETNGGDIKIYAGDADNGSTGYGGYINIDGGTGFDGGGPVEITGGQSTGSQGAPARITGGPGLTLGGDANISGGTGGNDNGGNVNVIGGYGANNGGQVNITGGQSALGLPGYGNVNIGAGASVWTFDYTGNLTLPGNTFTVNYANGDPVSLGSAALGNLTVSNITLQGIGSPYGDDGLNLAPGPDSTANLQYFRVRGGDYPTHIHFDTGNNNAYDQYFGDDNKYLKLGLGLAGNVSIGTYQDGGVGALEWIFDSNGNLVLAGGNSVMQSIPNSSLDPLNPNVSTMVLTPDAGYYNQALVLDPTAPGHIHLRAPSFTGNIDAPSANIFLGGETSSFEVGYGTNPNVYIHSNSFTWTFDTNGTLTVPATGTAAITGVDGFDVRIRADNTGGDDPSASIENYNGNTTTTQISANPNTATIAVDINTWTFDANGNLTLPGNTFAVNYANGTQVSLGGSYGNSNVATFLGSYGSNTISTTGNVRVGQLSATATDSYDAIQFSDNGTNDNGSIRVDAGSNMVIKVPSNFYVKRGGSDRVAVTDTTSDFMATTNVTIQSNKGGTTNTWSFYANGVLSAPGNIIGSGASPAPSINGFDSASFAGNISGGNLSVTGNVSGNTNGYTIGYLNIPQVAASNATIGLTDAGKHYYSTTAGNITLTVPLNSSVAFPTGTAISIVVQAAGNILVNAAAGVTLYMAGNSTSANRVVGTYGMATIMKVASDTWFINGTGVS